MPRVSVPVTAEVLERLRGLAATAGVSVAEAVRQLVDEAFGARDEGRQWSHFRADEVIERLERMEILFNWLGPVGLGQLRLLAHWATQSGGLKVTEDELLAELRSVGEDEWQQALEELKLASEVTEEDDPDAFLGGTDRRKKLPKVPAKASA